MRDTIVSLFSGALFAIGLGVAGMTQPDKIIGYLDFFGEWDPSLMGVMGGAVVVYAIAFRLIMKRPMPVFALKFSLPTRTDIDGNLVVGAGLFGIGWGLSGLCPGPGLASLPTGALPIFVFIGSMIAGMVLYRVYNQAISARPKAAAPLMSTKDDDGAARNLRQSA